MSILKNLEYRSSSATVFTFTLTQVGDDIVDPFFFSTTCSSSAGGASPSCVSGTSAAAPGGPAGPAGGPGAPAGDDSAIVAEAAVVVVVGEVTLLNSGTESSLLSRIAENKYITQRLVTYWNCYQPKLSSMREIFAATPSIRSSATTQSLMMMMSMLIMVVVAMVMVVVSVVCSG